jgi:hypothetical protein
VESVTTGINHGSSDNQVLSWPRPCDAFNSWGPLFATVVGLDGPGDDRSDLFLQDGKAFFAEATFDISDRWDVTTARVSTQAVRRQYG